jgi:hypothetical protein
MFLCFSHPQQGEGGGSPSRTAGSWEGSVAAEAQGLGGDPTLETRRGNQGGARDGTAAT